jgi:RNA polymerase sigma-70 factor (ECF subfamily)
MTDEAEAILVAGLGVRDPRALAVFGERFIRPVTGVLRRILGADPEVEDLRQEVFARAMGSIGHLERPEALSAWMTSITGRVARDHMRRRARRRWLRIMAPTTVPDAEAPTPSSSVREAHRWIFQFLDRLPVDERIAFSLRFIAGMELKEVAAACGVSLATTKRRLARADRHLARDVRDAQALRRWVIEASRWNPLDEDTERV